MRESTYPNFLFFNATERCNLNCTYCGVAGSNHCSTGTQREMDINKIRDIAQQFWEMGGERVCLAGGEPLLREDIFDIIESFSSKDFSLETNATLITKEIAKELKKK